MLLRDKSDCQLSNVENETGAQFFHCEWYFSSMFLFSDDENLSSHRILNPSASNEWYYDIIKYPGDE